MNNEKIERRFLDLVNECEKFTDKNINNKESEKFVMEEMKKNYKIISEQTPEKINMTYKSLINKTGREMNCSLRSIETIDIIRKKLFITDIWTRETIYSTFIIESEKLNRELKELIFDLLSRKDLMTKVRRYEELITMGDDSYANISSIMYNFQKILNEY